MFLLRQHDVSGVSNCGAHFRNSQMAIFLISVVSSDSS